jgi:hypothetical protein
MGHRADDVISAPARPSRWLLAGLVCICLGMLAAPSPHLRDAFEWTGFLRRLGLGGPGVAAFLIATLGQAAVIAGVVCFCLDLRNLSPAVSIWGVLARIYGYLLLATFGFVWTLIQQFVAAVSPILQTVGERMQ